MVACMDRMQGTRVTRSIPTKGNTSDSEFPGADICRPRPSLDPVPSHPRGDEEQAFPVQTVILSTAVCFDASRGERQLQASGIGHGQGALQQVQ